jgi:hypothetical protein
MHALLAITLLAVVAPTAAEAPVTLHQLQPSEIEGLSASLAAREAEPGLELALPGDDPRVGTLADLLREAQPARDHRCSDAGALRFRLRDGRILHVGLLPSHVEGRYGLRLWEEGRVLGTFDVERGALLEALEAIGLPLNHPSLQR